ncbi:MAG: heavy metal translocating P-type ATPase, partial [Acidimicrobiia bacterium]|nr:heavy metal translocating P-type ATPase [Acidimicrobiia bacterium]
AVAGALALEEFLTAAIIGLMLATGQYLESYAAGRAERELTALVERAPRTAHRLVADRIETISIDDVDRGDRLMVKPGEVVPVDGIIISGVAVLDEAALTGESIPVERTEGARVASGVVNAAGPFELRALTTAAEGTYAGVIRLVRQAQEERYPAVRLADRWAAWFVPLALGIAALAWAVSGDPVRGLAVLVVATPCPLLLAVPIAIVSGISRAARKGVIFRGGGALEVLARTEVLLLDKTGTLTTGEPAIRRVTTFARGLDANEALRLAAAVDQASTHVLARALVAEAHRRGLHLPVPSAVEEVAGGGVVGEVEGRIVSVGNAAWVLGDQEEPEAVAEFRREIQRMAPLTVFIAIDGDVVAGASFDDVIRPDAASTVRALRRVGIKRIVMATGDHPVVAQSVGLAVGIDSVLAECTPAEKVAALQDLRRDGVTAMVGDGINDAPALAAADVGVAMGARGATASSEAADVVLMVDRLQRLVTAIEIARRSRRIALQSVIIGMGMSFAAMIAAAFGLLPPIAGALVQEAIDVIAIMSALRALTGDRPLAGTPRLSP